METDEILKIIFSFTNYPDFYGVLVAILCFVVMVIIVLRVNEENIIRNFRAITRCEEKQESYVYNLQNPFSLKLSDNSKNLELSLKTESILYVYWGTSITHLFSVIQQPWTKIRDALKEGEWLKDCTLFIERGKRLSPGKHSINFQRPDEVSGEALGSRPRSRYPAVVITVVENMEDYVHFSVPQIIAMFSVIHVQDTVCSSESHIMYQYLKTTDDHVTTLLPLFVTSTDTSQTSSIPSGGDNANTSHTDPNIVGANNSHVQHTDFNTVEDSITANHSYSNLSGDNSSNINTKEDNSSNSKNDLNEIRNGCSTSQKTDSSYVHTYESMINGPQNTESDDINATEPSVGCEQENINEFCTECVVCQHNEVTIAFLPCRNTCVCNNCLEKLEKCPMCRGYIYSYFKIGTNNSNINNSCSFIPRSSEEVTGSARSENRWENINRRLNEFLGFQ